MRALLFLMILLVTTITPCVADNVTIEVLENSNGDFYISYNDDLIQCDSDDYCTFDVSNYTTNTTTTEFELTKDNINKIARRVVVEIDMNGIETGGVTKTFINESLIVTRNEVLDSLLPKLTNTFMPEIEKVEALEANLTASHDIIRDLRITAGNHDVKVSGLEDKIELLKDELFNTKIGIAGIAILFAMSLVLQGNRLQRGINFFKNMRK